MDILEQCIQEGKIIYAFKIKRSLLDEFLKAVEKQNIDEGVALNKLITEFVGVKKQPGK